MTLNALSQSDELCIVSSQIYYFIKYTVAKRERERSVSVYNSVESHTLGEND